MVLDGFFGADVTNVRDTRLLALAARVLSTRLNRIVREERQLVYSIRATSRPAAEYPGYGLFVAQAPTEPGKTAALAATLEELFGAFAREGPSADEMAVARGQIDSMPTSSWIPSESAWDRSRRNDSPSVGPSSRGSLKCTTSMPRAAQKSSTAIAGSPCERRLNTSSPRRTGGMGGL